jgi:hypothetical protein
MDHGSVGRKSGAHSADLPSGAMRHWYRTITAICLCVEHRSSWRACSISGYGQRGDLSLHAWGILTASLWFDRTAEGPSGDDWWRNALRLSARLAMLFRSYLLTHRHRRYIDARTGRSAAAGEIAVGTRHGARKAPVKPSQSLLGDLQCQIPRQRSLTDALEKRIMKSYFISRTNSGTKLLRRTSDLKEYWWIQPVLPSDILRAIPMLKRGTPRLRNY